MEVSAAMSDRDTKSGKPKKPVEARLERAARFEEQGMFGRAIGELKKAVRGAPDKARIYKELARLYRNRRRADDAILATRKALGLTPGDVQAREMLLEMLIEIGKFDDAIQEGKELLRISPRSLSARDALGVAYIQKGMFDKALKVANELTSLDPTSPVNHFKKACLYQERGDIGNAIQAFSRVLEMQPDSEVARDAQEAVDTLDSQQLRHIIMLAVEDYIFRAKLIYDPEAATLERGYFLSCAGMSVLKQIQFEDLPEVYAEWKQRYYH